MKYVNAGEILPENLLSMIQKHYQGGYLYIPKKNHRRAGRQTDYKVELQKRNQGIYLKRLEGRTNGQLGNIYHLSESSIRRIVAKERAGYGKMQEIIRQLLPLWGIEGRRLLQIYPSAWEVNDSYVIKAYDGKNQLERNIRIAELLFDCGIPVARAVLTKTGETYAAHENRYFLMSKKLPGSNISDIKDTTMAWKMGRAIARLHMAFHHCETEIEVWDNSLLQEMRGWVRENLINNAWQILSEEAYAETAGVLESVYRRLPRQLIHRDVHFGNFLFFEGNLSGYLDFDLSQRNIRIFDVCYFLTGLLTEETDAFLTKGEWLEAVKSVIAGYESLGNLTEEEKIAVPCVMECIEILFAAYFIGMNDTKRANDAAAAYRFIKTCEDDIKNSI